ncbi:MAG: hypothetical protein IIY20_03070, partial [Bifidobacteriaceae bacterium]|nr:hypothetical protein [Bifidobacteriaceae bacterium]
MANENFTAEEWIKYFMDKISRGEKFFVNDLREAVKTISVHDSVAASDALTVLYSGEGDAFPRALAEKAGSRVRMIDHTEAYKFLSHERFDSIIEKAISFENPKLDTGSQVFKDLHDSILFDASSGSFTGGTWEASDSFWSIVSRRFASETTGDVYALCVNAGPERIFAKDELKTLMDVLPDNARIGGFLKSEYAGLDDAGIVEKLKSWTREDLADTAVYADLSGDKYAGVFGRSFKGSAYESVLPEVNASSKSVKLPLKTVLETPAARLHEAYMRSTVYFDRTGSEFGCSFKDTILESVAESRIPGEYAFRLTRSQVSGMDVEAEFGRSKLFFDEFGVFKGQDFRGTKLEGLVSSDVPERFAYSMSGESYVETGSKLSSGQVRQALKDSTVFLDEAGGQAGRCFEGTVLDGVAESAVPGEYAHCVSGEVFERMPSEAQMSAKYGEAFDSLSARGRLRARELEGISGIASEVPKSGQAGFEQLESLRESYAKSAGKSAAELSEFENAFLNTAARRQAAAEAVSKAGGSSVFKAGSRASSWSSCKNWFKSAEGAKFL